MAKRKAESQIDTRPLKVRNHPYFLACKWRATYCWKDLNESYNFASDFISIGGLHVKLWAPKLQKSQLWEFRDSHDKMTFGAGPMAKHKVYYKGEGGGFPQVQPVVSLVSPILLVVRHSTKVLWLYTNQLVVWFVQVCVSEWLLVILPSPIPKFQHTPLPPKCCKPGSVPQLLMFSLFSHHIHIWIYQGTWECVTHALTWIHVLVYEQWRSSVLLLEWLAKHLSSRMFFTSIPCFKLP